MDKALLKDVEEDLNIASELIYRFSMIMMEENISKYPIYIAHQKTNILLGKQLIHANNGEDTHWSINASHLEEFFSKKIISKSKIDYFKQTYKNPKEYMCVFVLSEKEQGFIFLPYK